MRKKRKVIKCIVGILVIIIIVYLCVLMCFSMKNTLINTNTTEKLVELKENETYKVLDVRENSVAIRSHIISTISLVLEDENNNRKYVKHTYSSKNLQQDLTFETWAEFVEGDEVIATKEEPSLLLK